MKESKRELAANYIHGKAIVVYANRLVSIKKLGFILGGLFFILNSSLVYSQVNSLPSGIRENLTFAEPLPTIPDTITSNNSAVQDSLPPVVEPKLLPDHMSIGEKFLWGKNGFVRNIGLEPPLSPQERMGELRLRRTMLTAHQIGGFTTLALMLTADYFGQQVIDGHRNLGDIHQQLVAATIVSYTATGLLAILSPPPLIRRDEGGTTALHKTLAWIHVLGMIITPILGSTIRHHKVFNMDQAHFHQISGYLTTAVFATSMLVIVF